MSGRVPSAFSSPAKRVSGFRYRASSTMGIAHFLHDLPTAFLAPLLPLFIEKHGLSLFQAGTLSLALNLASFFNPFFGVVVDRHRPLRLLVSLAPTTTALAMGLVGLAPGYVLLLSCLLLAGLSNALFHVAAPVASAEVAGRRLGRGMSFFMVGGETARTVGPLVAVQAAAVLGLAGLWKLAIPAGFGSAAVFWGLSRVSFTKANTEHRDFRVMGKVGSVVSNMRATLAVVAVLMMGRGFVTAAMTHYLPTFMSSEGHSLWIANVALTVVEIGGLAGALASGTLSDLLGRRWVLIVAVGASPVLMLLFLAMGDHPAGLLVLGITGFVALSTTPVLMAITLENAGEDPATGSGLFIMMSFAVRSVIVLAIGAIGDAFGLRTAYVVCALVAAAAVPAALKVPHRA